MNPYQKRFDLIMSDPINELIPRDRFSVDDDVITMANGVKVYANSYYGQFSEVLISNQGVHEPSEEYVFGKIIDQFRGKSPVMVELGSYWAFYSMSLKKIAPEAKTICIDVVQQCLDTGKAHYELNDMDGEFMLYRIGSSGIPYEGYIDILHSDIQGDELTMLQAESDRFISNGVGYVFISTHSNDLHYRCLDLLIDYGYKILAKVDLSGTYCEDGIIVACSPNVDALYFDLAKRK